MASEQTQRRFAVLGTNTFRIANSLMKNQKICRLLKYPSRDALDVDAHPDVDGVDLINKQILIVPKFMMIVQKRCPTSLLFLMIM